MIRLFVGRRQLRLVRLAEDGWLRRPRPRRRLCAHVGVAVLLAVALVVQPALARAGDKKPKGKLAVVNAGHRHHETVEQAGRVLARHVGGWSGQPGISDFLAGKPNPGALPVGQTGKDLVRLVERVRTERVASRRDLTDLGRLLGVDYLLLMRVGRSTFVARLYSVRRARYSPHRLEARNAEVSRLEPWVLEETGAGQKTSKKTYSKWWIWAVAGGLAALTIGLALGTGSDTEGDLRIRVSR
jgi:hypothetical protein